MYASGKGGIHSPFTDPATPRHPFLTSSDVALSLWGVHFSFSDIPSYVVFSALNFTRCHNLGFVVEFLTPMVPCTDRQITTGNTFQPLQTTVFKSIFFNSLIHTMAKKILSLTMLLAMTFMWQVQAQVLQKAPANSAQVNNDAAKAASVQRIDPKEGEMWWGYYDGQGERGAVGISKAEIYHAAMFIPGDNPFAANGIIKAVRFYLRDKENIQDVKVWISKKLPSTAEKADVWHKLVDQNSLVAGDEGEKKLGMANDVMLDTPYELTAEGVYVGLTFKVTGRNNVTDHPIAMGTELKNVPGSLFLRTAITLRSWIDQSNAGFGPIATRVLIEKKFATNAAVPSNIVFPFGDPGQPVKTSALVTNAGKEYISTITYHIEKDGVAGAEQEYKLISPLSPGNSQSVPLTINAPAEPGTDKNYFVITKVNGKDNEATENKSKAFITVLGNLNVDIKKKVLVEEFTTENCGNCPSAAYGLAKALHDNPDIASQVAVICHHSGYYTDQFTTKADIAYEWFYGEKIYAPAFMYDRWGIGSTPVGPAGNYLGYINTRLKEKAPVSIELTATMPKGGNKIEVQVKGVASSRFGKTFPRLTLSLTEDNIPTSTQASAGDNYVQQHVNRAVNAIWGDIVEWDGNYYSYSYTFDVQAGWKTENLKVVAFMSDYDNTNPVNNLVYNCNVVSLTDPSGVTDMAGKTTDNTEVARYTIDGQRINAPQHGINIVKMADGSTRKVLVK